jgi:hypothetical protein
MSETPRPSLELGPHEMARDRTLVIATDQPLDLTLTDDGSIWIRNGGNHLRAHNVRCIYIDPRP